MGIIGKHIYGNLYDCGADISNKEFLEKIVKKAIKISKCKLVEIKSWEFGGKKGGVSVIALIMESHIAIHTWINYNYVTIDVYTCGKKSNAEKAFDYLVKMLKPKKFTKYKANRSQ